MIINQVKKGFTNSNKKITNKSISKELTSSKDNINIIEYSKIRSLFAVEIAKATLLNADESIIDDIKIASLLLDIGKCCKQFKNELKSSNKKEKKVKFLYNEIGWAFLSKYLHLKGSDFILDSVYWSNGITTNKNKKINGYNNNNVLDTINESDKSEMNNFLKNILPISEYNHYFNNIKIDSPTYYSKTDSNINTKKTFIRSCIISAEKLITSLNINSFNEILEKNDVNKIRSLIDNLTKRYFNTKDISFSNYNLKRINEQKNIIESCEKTTIINAPSGFGKSLIGVLWSLMLSNKKLIWVCPRNAVAQAVYINIINELNSLCLSNVSVELYLTGERKKINTDKFIDDFNSDIIITNIDNYLSPSINTNNAERLFFINNCDVVFDEYHELVRNEALFAGFVNIMNVRTRFTNSRTLLLSATPLRINNLWDNGINLKTKVLPDVDSHYSAVHKKKYELYINELDSIDKFKTKQKTSSVVVFNSVTNSQIIHNQVKSSKLIHSKFSLNDRYKIFDSVYENFDKYSSRFLSKDNITGTHVIQASLDVSFLNLYESILSPQSTLQRIGRCDRWGDYLSVSKIFIYKINDNGEKKMKDVLYTKSLSDKWFLHISKYDNKEINLDKIYDIYNEFHKLNSMEINRYIENCHDKSLQNFSKIYPKYFSSTKKNDNKVIIAGSNKLRSNGGEIFFICKVYNSEKYSDVISDNNQSYFKDFDEDEKTLGRMIKAMKSIRDKKDDRYDFTNLIDEWDINVIRESAKESNTPYIRFDVVYHPEYGVIKKSILNEITK